jgi:hypothetical protein
MLKLSKKRCEFGLIGNRLEHHGDKDVTAFDIRVTVLLDPDELDELLEDKYAHKALFATKGKVASPMFPQLDSFSMRHDIEAKDAILILLGDYAVPFENVRLKGLVLTPAVGGETELTFKFQCRPQPRYITRLLDAQKCEGKISLSKTKVAEKEKAPKQDDLELGGQPPKPADGNGDATHAADA